MFFNKFFYSGCRADPLHEPLNEQERRRRRALLPSTTNDDNKEKKKKKKLSPPSSATPTARTTSSQSIGVYDMREWQFLKRGGLLNGSWFFSILFCCTKDVAEIV